MNAAPDTAVDTATGCVLFTDLVGFTEFNDTVGDRTALDVLDRQTALARSVVEQHAGARVVKELGDGLMLWFPTAEAGLRGAAEFAIAARDARRSGFPLAVRMGLHYGECIRRGDDLIGQTVNVAARISDLAGPGELLVSEEVLEASPEAGAGLELSFVGPVSVKGVAEPVWLRRLD